MKILFAIDGSPACLAALETLLSHYDWFRDSPALTLVHVHPPVPYGMAARWVGKQAMADYYAEESATATAGARAELDRRGILYQAHNRVGEPARGIAEAAVELNADFIALGTHGHTALASLMLGSVAQKVLTQSRVPVLLLK